VRLLRSVRRFTTLDRIDAHAVAAAFAQPEVCKTSGWNARKELIRYTLITIHKEPHERRAEGRSLSVECKNRRKLCF